ncbi:MAG: LuxR C-terminal-related transcriptional regulator [Muribaculaceae bacterium]|nr:LuxR C-terminal-related transcriptional regulator [Muribaculaceae bacterium]
MIDKQQGYRPHNNMRELIRDNNLLLPAISRFDIAFGFGDSSIEKVCADNNVDCGTFLAVCNLLSGYSTSPSGVSLPSLMGYLRRAHSSFLDVTLPRIRHHLIEAINYSDTNDVAFLLMRFFDDYVMEVKRHMDHENDVVFAYVDSLLSGEADDNFCIARFSVNHVDMAAKLKELKDIFIYHYKQRDNARLSAALFDIIVCKRDMMSHFDVESHLFVPAVEQLENSLRTRIAESVADSGDEPAEWSQLNMLGEREKDIVRCVARGLSNKEIADELCLSVHTVTTHRRNISSKLGIHSTAGLIIFAIIHHLVDLHDLPPAG